MNCKLNYTTFVNSKLKKYPCQTEQSNELHPAPEMLLMYFVRFCLSLVCGVDTSSAVWGPSSVLYIHVEGEKGVSKQGVTKILRSLNEAKTTFMIRFIM